MHFFAGYAGINMLLPVFCSRYRNERLLQMAGENGNSTNALEEPFDDATLSSYAFFCPRLRLIWRGCIRMRRRSVRPVPRARSRSGFAPPAASAFRPSEISSIVPTEDGRLDVYVNHLGLQGTLVTAAAALYGTDYRR